AKNKVLNFRRSQAFTNLYQAVAELQLLTTADIADWAKFQKRFQAPRSEPVEQISTLLSDRTKSLLGTQTEALNQESQKQTITDLNKVLRIAGLYKSTVFSAVALNVEAQSL